MTIVTNKHDPTDILFKSPVRSMSSVLMGVLSVVKDLLPAIERRAITC